MMEPHLKSVYTFRIKCIRYFIIFLLSFYLYPSECFSILRIGRETKENNVGFQTKRLHVSDEGRYDRVKEILNTHEDSETLIEAIKEVLDISRNNSKNDDALQLIQSVVSRTDLNSSVYRRAKLAEARLLLRIDKKEEAFKIFREGIKEKWEENPFWEINSEHLELGWFSSLAIDEYDRTISDEYGKDVREFYGLGIDLSTFLIRLMEMKSHDENVMAMQDVYPSLVPLSSRWSHSLIMAKAMCLAMDHDWDSASKLLASIQKDMEENGKLEIKAEERKCFLLIASALHAIQGQNCAKSEEMMHEYIYSNLADPKHAFLRIMEIVYAADRSSYYRARTTYLTKALLDSDLIQVENIKAKIPPHLIASLYDMHAQGLFAVGSISEAKKLWEYVVGEYFPHNLASANAMFQLARIAYIFDKDNAKAQNYCRILSANTSFPELDESIRILLEKIEREEER